MSGSRPITQEYAIYRSGRRYPVHTPALKSRCRCLSCTRKASWTPERRAAMGERIKREWAEGTRTLRRNPNDNRSATWKPAEDAYLKSIADRYDCLTIGALLTERFGHPRSEHAVKHRCQRLGIARMDIRPLSSSEVGRIFGVTRETVRARFVNTGMLAGDLRRGGPHGMRMFTRAEIEALVREHPEAYDLEAIRDPSLKALALAVQRGRKPLSTSEVSRLTGIHSRTLAGWLARGLVPSARKVRNFRPGAGGAWLIPATDVAVVEAIRDGRADLQRERANARRDPLTGSFLRTDETPSTDLRCTIRVVDRSAALQRLAP